ncbi:DUF1153 domain-containing protein [Sphingomonas profundi]|uniref:DUF1153 domain-containing protein n=1 Tax=Alterirhizorhabdus profundi TaxID=2681549 RepID=UPI0012E8FA89|nr:DUF1153 domain-containing protein [Sphingomonas profundi]
MSFKARNFHCEVVRQPPRDITEQDLPPRFNRRWTSAMKAAVVAAIDGDLLDVREACRRYNLDEEEIALWRGMLGQDAAPVAASRPIRQIDHGYGRASGTLGDLVDIRI